MIHSFWSHPAEEIIAKLHSRPSGLTSREARKKLRRHGLNRLQPKKRTEGWYLLLSQFKSPLILLLIFAAILSYALHDKTDGSIILGIVVISGLLGFYQEKGATDAIQKLLQMVEVKARVLRDSQEQEISVEQVVPGDIVLLAAGDIIPGDALLLESKDFFIDEATLTGETYAVEKKEGVLPLNTPLAARTNALFMGSHVISGSAKAVIVWTGKMAEFGKVSEHLRIRPPETAFEHGVKHFGYFLLQVTLVLVLAIFGFNIYFARPFLESFLFVLALAVGLTPQLLPAIVTVNLAQGAKQMAKRDVIVKRLVSIENFGSMDVLCCDKTGTLTQGVVEIQDAMDVEDNKSEKVCSYAYLNAHFQTGYTNLIDQAILRHFAFDCAAWNKVDEIPYDFLRKRLSILVAQERQQVMICKGAFTPILQICTKVELASGEVVDLSTKKADLEKRFTEYSEQGYRLIGVCYKPHSASTMTKEDEKEMIFLGFLVLFDPLKEGIVETVQGIQQLGISLKIITGDHRIVAQHVAEQLGLKNPQILPAEELLKISDAALIKKVQEVDIFAEVEPNQKERIILALRKAGHTVGFLGDGINDATALHTADVGISVDSAADVAKQVADIVLLSKDLRVLKQGVQEGRKTFANTLKYIFMATSANFGNMFSMAGASLIFPFLPLLPKQILLTNLLTDFPEMTIATDHTDPEIVSSPVRWDIQFIRKFMIVFGLISSLFDYATFGILRYYLHADVAQFRTGWFLESVISAAAIVLVVRTRRPFFLSYPSKSLGFAVLGICLFTLALPFLPLAEPFAFVHLPLSFYSMLGAILVFYVSFVELAKKKFYR